MTKNGRVIIGRSSIAICNDSRVRQVIISDSGRKEVYHGMDRLCLHLYWGSIFVEDK